MSGARPEERVRVPLLRQGWRDIVFLHWSYPAGVVAELLPDRLRPDLFDGRAWVGLTPFLAVATRPPLMPPLGGPSRFPETNLRTYVTSADGLDGLWFLSLEADSAPTVLGGRLAGRVPYRRAEMSVEREGEVTTYRSRREADAGVGHHIVARRGEAIDEAGELAHWLTGRWRAWTSYGSLLATVPVQHPPWALHRAEVLRLDETITTACGLPVPEAEPVVHASPGVDVRLGFPQIRWPSRGRQ